MKSISNYLLVILLSLLMFSSAAAENVATVEEAALTQLMQALAQNDYEDFISSGTPQFKNGITKSAFNSVVKQVGSLIREGYKTEYLTQLNQQGYKVHLWKISYGTSKENSLAKLVIVDKKVAGFWLL